MSEETNETQSLCTYTEEEKPIVLTAVLGSLIGFIPPFIAYILKNDTLSDGAKKYIKDVLNFELVILCIAAGLVLLNLIPILGTLLCALLTPALALFNMIVIITATLAAADKKEFRYPFSHKFVD